MGSEEFLSWAKETVWDITRKEGVKDVDRLAFASKLMLLLEELPKRLEAVLYMALFEFAALVEYQKGE